MSGEKILKGLRQALAVASGEAAPARVHIVNPAPWRCETTGNPVGTDTLMIGAPACLCRGCRGAALEAENQRLRIALHDAIRRPMGVVPDSASEFYNERMADEAEARRPRLPAPIPNAQEEG